MGSRSGVSDQGSTLSLCFKNTDIGQKMLGYLELKDTIALAVTSTSNYDTVKELFSLRPQSELASYFVVRDLRAMLRASQRNIPLMRQTILAASAHLPIKPDSVVPYLTKIELRELFRVPALLDLPLWRDADSLRSWQSQEKEIKGALEMPFATWLMFTGLLCVLFYMKTARSLPLMPSQLFTGIIAITCATMAFARINIARISYGEVERSHFLHAIATSLLACVLSGLAVYFKEDIMKSSVLSAACTPLLIKDLREILELLRPARMEHSRIAANNHAPILSQTANLFRLSFGRAHGAAGTGVKLHHD